MLIIEASRWSDHRICFSSQSKMAYQAQPRILWTTCVIRLRPSIHIDDQFTTEVDGKTKTGKWVLFILPFITVLREGEFA
jgi:high-affinity Fe2+/Pb2+ permease